MPMLPPDDSANAADPLEALINGNFVVDAAVPFQFPSPSTNPLEVLLMQPKSNSKVEAM